VNKFLIILFLFGTLLVFPADKKDSLMYDTTTISSVKKASVVKEKEVFADKDFQYQEDAKESKSWIRAFFDWLLERIFGKMTPKGAETAWAIIKWVFIGVFIAGVIFFILRSKYRGLFKGDSKKLAGASFTDLPDDIESVNIDKLIEEALQSGNYRLAVRWCFLKALQKLNQSKQITWQPSKTNVDYEFELKDLNQRLSFNKLSYVFEYVWYGEIQTGEKLFSNYRSEIEKFNNSLNV
jgi:hypothetical protein